MAETVSHDVPDLDSCPLGLEVSAKVELKQVHQIDSSFKRQPSTGLSWKSASIRYSTRAEVDADGLLLLVFVTFELTATLEEDADPVVNIRTTFMLIYELTDASGFTEEHYSQFAKTNGVFNAWPYWRAYSQDVTLRMGLPALTVPVLYLYRPKPTETNTADSAESEASQAEDSE